MLNYSGILTFPKILLQPKLIVPKITYSNFNEINFEQLKNVYGIKCIVLDKDNCISKDKANIIYPEYLKNNWTKGLLKWYDMDNIVVVSNSIGSSDDTVDFSGAKLFRENYIKDIKNLQKNNIVDEKIQFKELNVIEHNHKKPGCYPEIIRHFIHEKKLCDDPSEIAIIGDRLFTDVLMGNLMKSFPIYLQTGVLLKNSNPLIKLEQIIYKNYINK
ncbi:hypothetical protein QEN19_000887 [Hanseniaspora menglaensis]